MARSVIRPRRPSSRREQSMPAADRRAARGAGGGRGPGGRGGGAPGAGGEGRCSGKGMASFSAAWRDFLAAWGEYRVTADELRALDAERILVLLTNTARGRASGLVAQSGTKGANVFYIRDGKVTKLMIYWDRDRA